MTLWSSIQSHLFFLKGIEIRQVRGFINEERTKTKGNYTHKEAILLRLNIENMKEWVSGHEIMPFVLELFSGTDPLLLQIRTRLLQKINASLYICFWDKDFYGLDEYEINSCCNKSFHPYIYFMIIWLKPKTSWLWQWAPLNFATGCSQFFYPY